MEWVQAVVEGIAPYLEGMGAGSYIDTWQDVELKFDAMPPSYALTMRSGESTVDTLEAVEDTKGNAGEEGTMTCTPLRIIWVSSRSQFSNLSIGYGCIKSISVRPVYSKLLNADADALKVIATQDGGVRYEFLFTSKDPQRSSRMFETVEGLHRAYSKTKMYRKVMARSPEIVDPQGELRLLSRETVFEKVQGVWNLASEQGVLGALTITNVRCTWHSVTSTNLNASLPYLHICGVRTQDTKYGHALVIETDKRSGRLLLGFRVDPIEKLERLADHIKKMWMTFQRSPVFGVEIAFEEFLAGPEKGKIRDETRQQIDPDEPAPEESPRAELDQNKQLEKPESVAKLSNEMFPWEASECYSHGQMRIVLDRQSGLAIGAPDPGEGITGRSTLRELIRL
ncbi:Bardet-Biedl syndrome 5 protein [Cladochytrium replicatum]|nr:Bardet-Biedl syndrome 5 protein [Cladochytrium replicatum]